MMYLFDVGKIICDILTKKTYKKIATKNTGGLEDVSKMFFGCYECLKDVFKMSYVMYIGK